nr:ORF6 [Bracoviriform inaniti]
MAKTIKLTVLNLRSIAQLKTQITFALLFIEIKNTDLLLLAISLMKVHQETITRNTNPTTPMK